MTTKHTPGPWKAVSDYYIATADNRVIARPTSDQNDPGLNNACSSPAEYQSIYNARLIAAAPDLLAALELADRLIDYAQSVIDNDYNKNQVTVAWPVIKDAIRKAKEI